jgi:threonine/homoserine/homoserine lactone efflux protein
MTADTLGLFALASFLLALVPGPDNLFVITQSALFGRRSGVLITLGLCSGLLVHTSLVALGLAALFQASPLAFTLLKMTGALYLLYLAWMSWQASATVMQDGKPLGLLALYRRGVIMNVTNPKVSIFFLAFLPQFTHPGQGSLALQIVLLGLVFMLVSMLTFCGFAVIAGSLRAWFVGKPAIQQWLNRVASLVFIGLSVNLVLP